MNLTKLNLVLSLIKKTIILVLHIICATLSSTVFAVQDPLNSPQWDFLHKNILKNEQVTFDSRVKVFAPAMAEDSLNVPISFKVQGIDNIKSILVFADFNPIPIVLNFYPGKFKPNLEFRVKLQQSTPVRVAVQTSDNKWHINGVWVDAAGGGCTLPSLGSAKDNWEDNLGKVSAKIWQRKNNNRLKLKIKHPMDTGLASGVPRFHLEELIFKDPESKLELARLELKEPINENPVLSLDVNNLQQFEVMGSDNNGNLIKVKILK